MKRLLTLQTIFIIFALTIIGAAQSGRIKKAIQKENEPQSSDNSLKKTEEHFSTELLNKATKNGIELYFAGRYEEAEEVFTGIIKADAQTRTAWFYLGLVYARTDRGESSEIAFSNAESLPQNRIAEEAVTDITPLQILFMPPPNYSQAAKRNLIGGKVKLAVEFGADGKIAFVCPVTKLDWGLTQMAVKAAWAIKFKPALKDGKPISIVKSLVYTFDVV